MADSNETPSVIDQAGGWISQNVLDPIKGRYADTTNSLASTIKEKTKIDYSENEIRGALPWILGGLTAATGFLFLDPIQRGTQFLFKGAEKLVTGFGLFGKIPLVGGLLTGVGAAIATIGEYAGAILPAIAGVIGYKMFETGALPEKSWWDRITQSAGEVRKQTDHTVTTAAVVAGAAVNGARAIANMPPERIDLRAAVGIKETPVKPNTVSKLIKSLGGGEEFNRLHEQLFGNKPENNKYDPRLTEQRAKAIIEYAKKITRDAVKEIYRDTPKQSVVRNTLEATPVVKHPVKLFNKFTDWMFDRDPMKRPDAWQEAKNKGNLNVVDRIMANIPEIVPISKTAVEHFERWMKYAKDNNPEIFEAVKKDATLENKILGRHSQALAKNLATYDSLNSLAEEVVFESTKKTGTPAVPSNGLASIPLVKGTWGGFFKNTLPAKGLGVVGTVGGGLIALNGGARAIDSIERGDNVGTGAAVVQTGAGGTLAVGSTLNVFGKAKNFGRAATTLTFVIATADGVYKTMEVYNDPDAPENAAIARGSASGVNVVAATGLAAAGTAVTASLIAGGTCVAGAVLVPAVLVGATAYGVCETADAGYEAWLANAKANRSLSDLKNGKGNLLSSTQLLLKEAESAGLTVDVEINGRIYKKVDLSTPEKMREYRKLIAKRIDENENQIRNGTLMFAEKTAINTGRVTMATQTLGLSLLWNPLYDQQKEDHENRANISGAKEVENAALRGALNEVDELTSLATEGIKASQILYKSKLLQSSEQQREAQIAKSGGVGVVSYEPTYYSGNRNLETPDSAKVFIIDRTDQKNPLTYAINFSRQDDGSYFAVSADPSSKNLSKYLSFDGTVKLSQQEFQALVKGERSAEDIFQKLKTTKRTGLFAVVDRQDSDIKIDMPWGGGREKGYKVTFVDYSSAVPRELVVYGRGDVDVDFLDKNKVNSVKNFTVTHIVANGKPVELQGDDVQYIRDNSDSKEWRGAIDKLLEKQKTLTVQDSKKPSVTPPAAPVASVKKPSPDPLEGIMGNVVAGAIGGLSSPNTPLATAKNKSQQAGVSSPAAAPAANGGLA